MYHKSFANIKFFVFFKLHFNTNYIKFLNFFQFLNYPTFFVKFLIRFINL